MEENWKFYHVGVIVRDMDKAVKYYQSLGFDRLGTPRLPSEFMLDSSTYLPGYEAYGKTPDTIHKTRMLFVNIGSGLVELIQPVEGETPYKEFLDSKGEGVHHIAYIVDNLEEETAKLVEKGIPVITKIRLATGVSLAYFDTAKVGNVITELVQPPK